MEGPDSSYSCFEIHICWKVESDERIERSRPIHGADYSISRVDGKVLGGDNTGHLR